jgi:hypothetical protein
MQPYGDVMEETEITDVLAKILLTKTILVEETSRITLLKPKNGKATMGEAAQAAVNYKKDHTEEHVRLGFGGNLVVDVTNQSTSGSIQADILKHHNTDVQRNWAAQDR